MLTPDRGALRLLRSGVLAACALGLSAGAHALAGGHLPGAAPLAALAAATWTACWVAVRWRLPAPAVVALLGAGQVGFHAALSALEPAAVGGHGAARAVPAGLEALAATGNGHAHATTQATSHLAGHASALWLGGPTSADAAMLLAHTAAAAAVGLVVARGEAALWDLCAWLAPLAPSLLLALLLLVAPPGTAVRRRPAAGCLDRPRLRRELSRLHRRRGPPGLLAA
ncbi:hypothetical protein [Quadrisphaera sp. INWT6]|uniref:hypothetical protein n=1 Tax=Quadrisphaera sp. INWT6 TaxID=2596917 RepID=UPI0018926AA9|nr:hypothetical protein [Quadrisphaera sp. INWT6]MBF5083034.1 hypothetical protein [Quadrisphaera sp. INWT6]